MCWPRKRTVSFPYLKTPDGLDYPVADISLSYRQRVAFIQPLVDSGASISIFSEEVAEGLGVPIERGRLIDLGGVGGRIKGFMHTVTMTIGKQTFKAPVVFSQDYDVSFNLLGRDGVFEHFLITFDEKKKRTIFKER